MQTTWPILSSHYGNPSENSIFGILVITSFCLSFEDSLDLERVLEFEPWTFDKNIVVFERVTEVEEVPLLGFSKATFWAQFHNVPEKSLNQATGEAVGNTIGKVIEVADSEDDDAGGEFLSVRISIDISKRLSRCRKLCSEGK